ncbi:MAG TPA: type II toxin-antitoxin system RelE/ParE family toxin [Terriglobales bacterium]|nr:type II toxin-antitoxin system RelE/ParE family toxin [Terriglobales bacterium]
MAGKRIEIHPAALAELKSAVEWYLERSEPAAREFVAEVDRAIDLVMESPRRWPAGEHDTRRFVLQRSLSQSLTGKRIRACKSWHSLMDTAAPDTGRNGCSG